MPLLGFIPSLPDDDIEYRLAHRLLGRDNKLDYSVLVGLVGRPRRYSDLKPLVEGKSDNNLTESLVRLRKDGLIAQRVNARRAPPIKSYELTELGVRVVFCTQRMIPAKESAETLNRGALANAR